MNKAYTNEMKAGLDFETLTVDDVADRLSTSKDGLSDTAAAELLALGGKNVLPSVKRKSMVVRFLLQFHNALLYVLLGAAVLTAIMAIATQSAEYWVDTGVILGVVVINVIIGFVQESKAQKALDSIKGMLSLKAAVVRDGVRKDIDAEDLVVGDVVYLRAGDRVPADIRLISVNKLEVDESALTGESLAVSKGTDAVGAGTVLGERTCLVYAGTTIRVGDALGIVVGTAGNTEIGKINRMLSETTAETTPLMKKMNKFGKMLTVLILAVSLIMMPISIFAHGMPWEDALLAVIGVAVAAIPEGLPSIVVIILAMGVQRMAKKRAIVKKLPSVETLGSVTVICSDKTGTLTKNEMTATAIYTAGGDYEVTGSGYEPVGRVIKSGQECGVGDPNLEWLIRCADVCNEASVLWEGGVWTPQGAPTEAALKVLAAKAGFGDLAVEKIADIPFDSEYKYHASLVRTDGKNVVLINGAPERILGLCSGQNIDGKSDNIDMSLWESKIVQAAGAGQRMIGLAYAVISDDKATLEHGELGSMGLVFLGIVGIIDPPKPDAIEAIKVARAAGIRVKMITGDHVLTAREIGRQMGLTDNPKVVSGADLEQMDDEQIRAVALQCDIFARTSPEHKLRLVMALQESGEIVSMTGDGVNDAPALKRADIGVAMGIKGTDVTKDSSEMILADDNFATIVSAVSEGRTIYDNLQKTIIFTLPIGGAQAFAIIFAMIIGFTLPLSALQVLWVNMVVAITLTLALSFENPEANVMSRAPRNPKERLVGGYTLLRTIYTIAVFSLLTFLVFWLFYQVIDLGFDSYTRLAHARTLAVNVLALGACAFYLLNCKKRTGSVFSKDFLRNKVVLFVIGLLIVMQILFTYLPPMQALFGGASLRAVDWLIVAVVGVVCLLIVELEKLVTRLVLGRKRKLPAKAKI